MNDIKTALSFSDGEIFETSKYCGGVSPAATTVEKVKFFLSDYIMKHRLSGSASIEVVAGALYVDHHVLPKRYTWQLCRMLTEKYHVQQKEEQDR